MNKVLEVDFEKVSRLVDQLTIVMDGSSLADLAYAIGITVGDVEDCAAMKSMCMAIATVATVAHNEQFHGVGPQMTH